MTAMTVAADSKESARTTSSSLACSNHLACSLVSVYVRMQAL